MLTIIRHKNLTQNRVAAVITGYNCFKEWRAHFQVITVDTVGKYGGNTLVDRDSEFKDEYGAIEEFNRVVAADIEAQKAISEAIG